METKIEPSEKYRAIVNAETNYEYENEEEYRDKHPAPDVADDYVETIDNAPEPEDYDTVEPEPLSWSHFNVSKDPDLLNIMATYFDGIHPSDPSDLKRAKLRLLDPEVYANAQIAAQTEQR